MGQNIQSFDHKNRDVRVNVKNFLSDVKIYEDKAVQAVVLFADLVGSTEFKRYHSAREGLAKVLQHNEVVSKCVGKYGGSVIKYLGDGVMVMFEGENREIHALEAGLEIIRQMNVVNDQYGWKYPFSMSTKMGIHSGPVWMFLYENSGEDPQGTTVDVAARLTSLAGPSQIMCSKEVYDKVGQTSRIPKPSVQLKRYLRGIKERFDLFVIMPEGFEYKTPDIESFPFDLENRLKKAYRLFHEKKSDEAFNEFKQIGDMYPDCFLANICMAEHLLQDHGGEGLHYKDQLSAAEEYIDQAMCCRPTSCQVWLLLSSLHFKYFELDHDVSHIHKAIEDVRKAARLAHDWQNAGGSLQAKVCLIHYLQTLAREDPKSNALDEARKLCVELEPFISRAFNDYRSSFYVAYTWVLLLSKDKDYLKLQNMVKMAKDLYPANFRVCEVEKELVKLCHPNGGVAGMFDLHAFE
jgi:class 3 adenylate cyclase